MAIVDSSQKIGISFRKQTDLATARTAQADFWLIPEYGGASPNFALNTEDDSEAIGKGTHFATQVYNVSQSSGYQMRMFGSSQILALLFALGYGKSTKTTPATGAYQYVCTPLNPCSDGLSLPAISVVNQACSVIDELLPGQVLRSFEIDISNSPSRQSVGVNASFIGTGKRTAPSSVTLPTSTLAEKFLSSSGLTFTFNGTTYTTGNKNFESCRFSWDNNVDPGYVGGGTDATSGAALAGRMYQVKPSLGLSFVILVESGGTEYTKLIAQTEGTAQIAIQGPLITGSTYHSLQIDFPKVRFSAVEKSRQNGFIALACTAKILYDSTNGATTATIITDQDNIAA